MKFLRIRDKLEKMNSYLVLETTNCQLLCYAKFTMGIEELTIFGLTKSSTLPSLPNKHFSSLRGENDELIYT